jgi:hypothetical protein
MAQRKNAAAVALGRRRAQLAAPGEMSELGKQGGRSGGRARAANMSAAERSAGARTAAQARWAKAKKGNRGGKKGE